MKHTMQRTLTMGFKLNLTDSTRQSLAASLEIDPSKLSDFLNPQESDYIHVPVRALSATSVQSDTINFGYNDGQALKDAVEMFNGLTVLKDHIFSVDNWVGHTERSYWDSTTPDVPPGVNTIMAVDTKADPKLARGLISGDVNSVSVTVAFVYEKSHPKMEDMEFFMNLGNKVDGKLVQALVTGITRLFELSVVWQGADQYAKQIGADGRIEVPGTAANSLKETIMDWKKLVADLGLTITGELNEASVLAALAKQGQDLKIALAQVTTLGTDKQTLQTEKDGLQAQLTAKTTEAANLTTEVEKLKPNATLGEQYLKDQRAEALRLYNLVEGDKATEAMRKIINESNLEVAKSFITSYSTRADQIAPMSCTKCGCTQLSRKASAQQSTGTEDGTQVDKLKAARLESITGSMHSK